MDKFWNDRGKDAPPDSQVNKTLKYDPNWVIITRNFFIEGDQDIYSLQSNNITEPSFNELMKLPSS